MKKISRRQFLQVSATATAGALLAACGGTATQAPTTQEPVAEATKAAPPTATPKAVDTPTPVPDQKWPRESVARNRTLALSYSSIGGVGIGNCYATGFTHQSGDAAQMEPMFFYAALNDKTYPWLADSYEYNADATEMTVFVRKGAKWNDGTPFTAKDIAFTYNYLIKHADAGIRDGFEVKSRCKSIEAVDDYTVKFTLNEPDYRFHFSMCSARFDKAVYLIPEHIFKDVDTPLEFMGWDPGAHPEWPVYSGPYKLTRTEENFRQFDLLYSWWAYEVGLIDHMPWPERITNILYPSDEVGAQLLINNEIDAALDMRPSIIKPVLEQAPHIISHTGHEAPYGYVDWWPISMYFNCLEKPYDNPDVRWAVCHAVNQQTLVDVGYEGAGKVTAWPFPDYPGITKYYAGAKSITDKYDVLASDQAKVEELMTKAGYSKNAEGFWADADGTALNADVYAPVPLFGDIGPVTVELLRQAGFNANHLTPPDVWTLLGNGTALLHFFGHGGSVDDPYVTMDYYHSKWQKPTGEDCGNNRPRWANPEYDAAVEEMSRTSPSDTAKMQELFNKAMEIWLRELPEVPLVQWFHRLAMNTTYWTEWPNQDNPYNSAFWHITFPITLWNLKPTQ
ncbi:MAG TPA: ABC transporter substrate-binding protein [Anaerolineae bacterium]|nr:ABC transporter substrate-binding protein [Anaerolineae bacterium]